MSKFGWLYPAGCTNTPYDEDLVLPKVGDKCRMGNKKGIVMAAWNHDDDETPDWVKNKSFDGALVGFEGEDAPRAVDVMELLYPCEELLIDRSYGECDHCVGVCCDTTGVVYFHVEQFGGQWYTLTVWDGHHCVHNMTEDDGPWLTRKEAIQACVDAGFNAIDNSCWQDSWKDEYDELTSELDQERRCWQERLDAMA